MSLGSSFLWTLACFLVITAWAGCVVEAVPVNSTQRDILYRIRDEMPALENLPFEAWTNDSIDNVCDTYELYGVGVCDDDGWITQMAFVDYGLDFGEIAPSLGDMAELTLLRLQYSFSGSLQPALGNLSKLETLTIASLSEPVGPVPDEWKNMKALKYFTWTGNVDTPPQTIPDWIDVEWPQLLSVVWSSLQTFSSFPASLVSHPNLGLIDLRNNQLQGTLPAAIASNSKLTELNLQNNHFNGSITPDWSGATRLNFLYLADNEFSGELPTSFASNLRTITASNNQFVGSIPQSWMDLEKIVTIVALNNQLVGPLPWPTVPENSTLQEIYIGDNPLTGASIPSSFFHLPNLLRFYARRSQITGPLPDDIQPGCQLVDFSFSDTPLGGSLPSRIDLCSQMEYLYLRNASLSGTLHDTDWSNLTSLRTLELTSNNITGSIPESLMNLSTEGYLLNLFLIGNSFDLCANSNITSQSISSSLNCNLSGQNTLSCGCASVWTQCSGSDEIPTCPPTPTTPSTSPSPPPTQSSCPSVIPTGFECNEDGKVYSPSSISSPSLSFPNDLGIINVNGSVTVTTTINFDGIGTSLNINGCLEAPDGIVITITKTQSSEPIELIKQNDDCPFSLSDLNVKILEPKSCKKTKLKNDGSTRSSLTIAFVIDSSQCNVKWIILGSVLGGVIVLAVVGILIAAKLSPRVRNFFNPYKGSRT